MTAPTSRELATTPELGLLTALQTIVELSVNSLVAAHPELADLDDCPWALEMSPSYRAAQRFVPLARKLVRTIADYRHAQLIERQRPLEDDLPF